MARLGRSQPIQALTCHFNILLEGQFVWYAVYDTTTGDLLSLGTIVTDPLPEGVGQLELVSQPGSELVWDTITRTFVLRDPDPLVDRAYEDLPADASLAAVWAALDPTQDEALKARVATLLGPYRYRSVAEEIDLT